MANTHGIHFADQDQNYASCRSFIAYGIYTCHTNSVVSDTVNRVSRSIPADSILTDAIGAYFEETSPNLWSYSDFLEKVVKPISHTLYDRDLIKANRVWKKRFISAVKDIANKEVPVVLQRAAAKILKPGRLRLIEYTNYSVT